MAIQVKEFIARMNGWSVIDTGKTPGVLDADDLIQKPSQNCGGYAAASFEDAVEAFYAASQKTGCLPCESKNKTPTDAAEKLNDTTTAINQSTVSAKGPYETTRSEYKLPAAVHEDILGDRKTELWASVTRPKNLSTMEGPRPLLVLLHGNHGTCGVGDFPRHDNNTQYTRTGTCPDGYIVVPNHAGYDYVADDLASYGYIVVSINANRGITAGDGVIGDSGLNQARGRLVLKHLELLAKWHREGAENESAAQSIADELKGKLDFSEVGFMGHSRGGEGVRFANHYLLKPESTWPAKIGEDVNIRAIFEIGPVDGQSDTRVNAENIPWTVLLPLSDGDVSDLAGKRVFDRMIRGKKESNPCAKAVYAVEGANHNYYNSEWHHSDAYSTDGDPMWNRPNGRELQRQTGHRAMIDFFRAYVGKDADTALVDWFNPEQNVPTKLTEITDIDRGYSDSTTYRRILDSGEGEEGHSSTGQPIESKGITVSQGAMRGYNRRLTGYTLQWEGSTKSEPAYFQTQWSPEGEGQDVSSEKTLTLRMSRRRDVSQPDQSTDLSLRLVMADGTLSKAISLREHLVLDGPDSRVSVLQTLRIPLTAFEEVDLKRVRGLRLVFDEDTSGALYLSDIAFSSQGFQNRRPLVNSVFTPSSLAQNLQPDVKTAEAKIVTLTRAAPGQTLGVRQTEIVIESDTPFVARNALLTLKIGDKVYRQSRYVSDDMCQVAFVIDDADPTMALEVGYEGDANSRWIVS